MQGQQQDIALSGGNPGLTLPRFSETPSALEITQARVFEEPLVAMGQQQGPPGKKENRALAQALTLYLEGHSPEELSALIEFLALYPHSAWRAALLTNIGMVYRRTGYFTRALEAWEEAWTLSKHETASSARRIADKAVGALAELNARLGRSERLESLFQELEGRDLRGPATQRIQGAREGLSMMRLRPDAAFRCGPMALSRLLAHAHGVELSEPRIFESRSTAQGMSLVEVVRLSEQLGLGLQMARRSPGAPVLVPAVAHWRTGHFAALTREEPATARQTPHYLMQDPTFEDDLLMSRDALEAESSGYFLVRQGALPEGWSVVEPEEGSRVWGKGNTGDKTRGDPPCGPITAKPCCGSGGGSNVGMPDYNFHLLLTGLIIRDTPVGYAPERGPAIQFTATYHQADAFQPAVFSYTNLGHKWTFDWLSYVTDDPSKPTQAVSIYLRGSGTEDYKTLDATTGRYETHHRSEAVLVRTSPTSYERRLPDGAREVFSVPDGARTFPRKVFLSQFIDKHGQGVALAYDTSLRLVSITDALGQVTTLSYELDVDPLKITQVTDPFGRSARFEYNGNGQLARITDVMGLASSFRYATGDFIEAMTTPYGTTRFRNGINPTDARNTWIEATDALGNTERAEYRHDAPGIRDTEAQVPKGIRVTNGYLQYRNTFYWNKQAWREHPGDYTKAHLVHWLHSTDANVATGIRESEKQPLESRVWYAYPGQRSPINIGQSATPSSTARVLDDGTTQLRRTVKSIFCVPGVGKSALLEAISAAYDDGNFLRIFWNGKEMAADKVGHGMNISVFDPMTGALLAHQPFDTYANASYSVALAAFLESQATGNLIVATVVGDASRNLEEKAKLAFEALGSKHIRKLAACDSWAFVVCKGSPPLGEKRVPRYAGFAELAILYGVEHSGTAQAEIDPLGRLTVRIEDPTGTDLLELRQLTAEGLELLEQYTYDARHQPLTHRDASGGLTTHEYDALGRRVVTTNPKQQQTHYSHDDRDQLVQVVGPLGTSHSFSFDACGRVHTITDSLGVTITYEHDALDRLVKTQYPDGTHEEVIYEHLDPVRTIDRKGNETRHEYNALRQRVSSTNPIGLTTRFVWSRTDKIHQLTDPKGQTTAWKHDIQGRLVSTLFADGTETRYVYENTTSRVKQAIDQAGRTTQFTYSLDDNLKRVDYTGGVTTPSVSYTYDPYYNRPLTMLDGIGTTAYTYKPVAVAGALQMASIEGPVPNSQVSFTYDELGRQVARAINGVSSIVELDAGGRRVSETNVLGRFDYTYVEASSFLSKVKAPNGQVTEFSYYSNEQEHRLKGITVQSSAQAMISQFDYSYLANGDISSMTVTTPSNRSTDSFSYDGANRLTEVIRAQGVPPLIAKHLYQYDGADNRTSTQIIGDVSECKTEFEHNSTNQLVGKPCGDSTRFTYDLMGNLLGDGKRRFEWDAANRLVVITTGTRRSEFSYDGLGRRTRVIEKHAGALVSDKWLIWIGLDICEEREVSSGAVTRRFLEQGLEENAVKYYYTRDHLDSIRGMTNANGGLVGQYDYDPTGKQTIIAGDKPPPFGFGRLWTHESSGLALAVYRAYDSTRGRWLSRDPLQDFGWRLSTNINLLADRNTLTHPFEASNTYRYTSNSPVNHIDPLGLTTCETEHAKCQANAGLMMAGVAAAGITLALAGVAVVASGALAIGALAVAAGMAGSAVLGFAPVWASGFYGLMMSDACRQEYEDCKKNPKSSANC